MRPLPYPVSRDLGRAVRGLAACLLIGLTLPDTVPPATAQQVGPAQVLQGVGFEQRLDQPLPLQLHFRDEQGQEVRLGDYFRRRPVILVLVYYECPMLCTEVLNGLVHSLRALSFDVGKQFEVVTVSFDPSETPELAAAKKAQYLQEYGRPGAEQGWHFLTGQPESIRQLTEAVGFRYVYDAAKDQYAHASGIMSATPQGRLSRYFFGIDYSPRDLRLGLIEAAENRIGSPVDQLLLLCFHYDPVSGKYGFMVMKALQLAGMGTVVLLASLVGALAWRERRHVRIRKG